MGFFTSLKEKSKTAYKYTQEKQQAYAAYQARKSEDELARLKKERTLLKAKVGVARERAKLERYKPMGQPVWGSTFSSPGQSVNVKPGGSPNYSTGWSGASKEYTIGIKKKR